MENYKRVLLKLSGEMFGGESGTVLSKENVSLFAGEIASLHNAGKEVGVVIGGGNIFRGILADEFNIERSDADHMGMLATCINGLALQSALEDEGVFTRMQTALEIKEENPWIILKGCSVVLTLKAINTNGEVVLQASIAGESSSSLFGDMINEKKVKEALLDALNKLKQVEVDSI